MNVLVDCNAEVFNDAEHIFEHLWPGTSTIFASIKVLFPDLWFIRHNEKIWNLRKLPPGCRDSVLTTVRKLTKSNRQKRILREIKSLLPFLIKFLWLNFVRSKEKAQES
jgi:hypothetical protein